MCYLRVPFQLAKPPGFHVTHIPKGNFVYYAYDQVYVLFSGYLRRHFLMHVRTPAKKKKSSRGTVGILTEPDAGYNHKGKHILGKEQG